MVRTLIAVLAKVVYWLVVVVVSVVLLVLLIRFFESRDESNIDGAGGRALAAVEGRAQPSATLAGPRPVRRANTTIRSAAL